MKYRPLNLDSREADFIVQVLNNVLGDESYYIKNSFTGKFGATFVQNIIAKAQKIAPKKGAK